MTISRHGCELQCASWCQDQNGAVEWFSNAVVLGQWCVVAHVENGLDDD